MTIAADKEVAYQEWKARKAAGAAAPTVAPPARDFAAERQALQSSEDAARSSETLRSDAERAAPAAAVQQGIQDLTSAIDKPVEKQAVPIDTSKHLDPKQLMDSASVWMTLGAFAGLLTRQPMTAALGNMTAAIKGAQEGDMVQFEQQHQQWKSNFDAAMKANKAMLDEKRDIINDRSLSLTARSEALRLVDLKNGATALAQEKYWQGQHKNIDSQERQYDKSVAEGHRHEERAQALLQHEQTRQQAERHFQALHGSPGGQPATNDEELILGIAEGRINPNVVSIRNNQRARIMQEVARRFPDYDQKEYISRVAANRAWAVGKQGDAARSFAVVDSHLKTLDELGTALNNGDLKAFNKVGNIVSSQMGYEAPTNFDAAKRIVADEIVKAVTGAAGALGDRETADKTLSDANSPQQLKGVIATYRKLIQGQMEGLERQYKRGTGKDDFKKQFGIGGDKPQPTDKDRAVAKRSSDLAAMFKEHFGVDP